MPFSQSISIQRASNTSLVRDADKTKNSNASRADRLLLLFLSAAMNAGTSA